MCGTCGSPVPPSPLALQPNPLSTSSASGSSASPPLPTPCSCPLLCPPGAPALYAMHSPCSACANCAPYQRRCQGCLPEEGGQGADGAMGGEVPGGGPRLAGRLGAWPLTLLRYITKHLQRTGAPELNVTLLHTTIVPTPLPARHSRQCW